MLAILSDLQLAYLLLFGATLFLVEGLFFLYRDRRGPTGGGINRRLQLIAAGKDRGVVLNSLRRTDLDPVSAAIVRVAPMVERLIREAGLTLSPRRLLVFAAAIGGVAGALLLPFAPPAAALAGGVALGLALPPAALAVRRRSRLAAFQEQMPEALEMMVRSLRAGHPIASAIGMVASEMADPAGSEFGIVVDEMTYGLDVNTALHNLTQRLPHPDLAFFMVAVQIQSQTGGNLAEVLSNLATVIRDRFTLKLKVRVITSQGRSSAFVVAMMPLLTIAGISVIAPGYFQEVAPDPMFLPAAVLAAFLWVGGLLVMARIVRFRM